MADLVFSSAIFIPFEEIPALQDIADGPLEWAVMGMNRARKGPGDISDAFGFDYELYVECPHCVSLVEEEHDTTNNCDLPDTF